MSTLRALFWYGWLPVTLIFAWQAISQTGWIPAFLLPAPTTVLHTAWSLLSSGALVHHAWVSSLRVLGGFWVSASLAIGLAFLFHRFRWLSRSTFVLVEALRLIPPLSLVPLLILWMGIDEAPKIAIVVLATFFPVYLSVSHALENAEQKWDELSAMLTLPRAQHYRHILWPATLPALSTGLQIGFGYAWRALVSAELLAAASGLGYLIEDAATLMHTDVVLVGVLTIALLGMLSEALFKRFLTRLIGRKEGK